MRTDYFSFETIGNKSQEMLNELRKRIPLRTISFNPERSALLVIDMQKYFLDKHSHACIPSALPIVPRIKKLVAAFTERNLPVILTRHLNTKGDAKCMAQWWADLITEESDLSEISPELTSPNSVIIKKTQYDAFYQTILEDVLKEKGVSQLVITGVMSNLCCETTARSAFIRGFMVFLPVDGTATYTEDFHWASLLNLSYGFAIPILSEDIQKQLEASKHGG